MQNSGELSLYQGVGKTSGKPFTALKLKIGKWSAMHFPTSFEKDYLIEYLKDNSGQITLSPANQSLLLTAGDYQYTYKVESVLEYRYITKWFQDNENEAPVSKEDDALNLDNEDDINPNFPFN